MMRKHTLTLVVTIAAAAGGAAHPTPARGPAPAKVGHPGGSAYSMPPATCGAAEAAARPPSFWRDARLSRPLTYSQATTALGDIVRQVGADTGVRLSAAPEVADEPVAVVVQDMPAHDLLDRLASLLDYRWARRGKEGNWRFEIWQDLAGRQREQRLRDAAVGELMTRLRTEIDRHVAVASLPTERQRQILDEGQRRRDSRAGMSDEQWGRFIASPQEAWRSQLFAAAAHVSEPAPRALALLLGRVSGSQWAAVEAGGSLIFSTKPGPGELGLPKDVADALHTAGDALSEPHPGPDAPDDRTWQQWQAQQKEQWQMAGGFRVTLGLGDAVEEYRTGQALSLQVNTVPIGAVDPGAPTFFWPSSWNALFLSVGPPPPPAGLSRDPAEQTAMEHDPVLGKSLAFRPGPAMRSGPPGLFSTDGLAPWRLPELLPAIAHAYGVQFLSDAYWSAPIVRQAQIPAGSAPLFELLDRLAGTRATWDHDGSVIRLRSRTWFLDRPREVPLRLTRRWDGLCRRYGALSLDEYANSVSALTDEQLESLESMVEDGLLPSWMQDLAGAYASRHALRLIGSLFRAQRDDLWYGRSVPAGQMTPTQRELFLRPLRERARYRVKPAIATDQQSARLSFVAEPFVRIGHRREGRALDRPQPSPGQPEARQRPNLAPSGGRTSEAVRWPLDRLKIRFAYGPGVEETAWVTVTAPGASETDAVAPSAGSNRQGGVR